MGASEHDYYKSGFCDSDDAFMQAALDVAAEGGQQGEVPVGAVIVHQGIVIAKGYNQPILSHDATAHAEIVAIRQACQYFDNYRLPADCELFVTLEPCTMCVGAMLHARLKRVVFGAYDAKTGAAGSQSNVFENLSLNHQTAVQGGVLADECAQVLQDFFKTKRALQKSQ